MKKQQGHSSKCPGDKNKLGSELLIERVHSQPYLGKKTTDLLCRMIVLEQWCQCDNYLFMRSLWDDVVIL